MTRMAPDEHYAGGWSYRQSAVAVGRKKSNAAQVKRAAKKRRNICARSSKRG